MGIEGIENMHGSEERPEGEAESDLQSDQRQREERPDGEAERQSQDEERLRDHAERQERLSNPPLTDEEVVERQKREEEGIEPTEPTQLPAEVDPSSPPNPGGGNAEE